MKNPYVIIHGVHKNNQTNWHEVDWEVVIPSENGGASISRGTTPIGKRIEVQIEEVAEVDDDPYKDNVEKPQKHLLNDL